MEKRRLQAASYGLIADAPGPDVQEFERQGWLSLSIVNFNVIQFDKSWLNSTGSRRGKMAWPPLSQPTTCLCDCRLCLHNIHKSNSESCLSSEDRKLQRWSQRFSTKPSVPPVAGRTGPGLKGQIGIDQGRRWTVLTWKESLYLEWRG